MILDREITIEQQSITQDGTTGIVTTEWIPLVAGSPVERFPANVQDVMPSRSEAVRSGNLNARNQTRIRIRWRDDVNATMRVIVHGDSDVTYQIVGGPAEIGGRKQYLEMVCERFVP